MAARLIAPTEAIEVKQLCVVLYGQPGSRKTSLAQTADAPLTLAFDEGISRAFGRKHCYMFDTWDDVRDCDYNGFNTIVLDTAGMAMEKLASFLIKQDHKNGMKSGALSIQGYGALASAFGRWVSELMQMGKDLVMICHEESEKSNEGAYYYPAFVGQKFYSVAMRYADLVGYLHFDNGQRCLNFNPTDRWMAKAPPCGWERMVLPDFSKEPNYLARLISEAKASMGKVSAASAQAAKEVEQWKKFFASAGHNLAAVNGALPDIAAHSPGVKAQAWALFERNAKDQGWEFDKATKQFFMAGDSVEV